MVTVGRTYDRQQTWLYMTELNLEETVYVTIVSHFLLLQAVYLAVF